jgi:hypothetical protein
MPDSFDAFVRFLINLEVFAFKSPAGNGARGQANIILCFEPRDCCGNYSSSGEDCSDSIKKVVEKA